jgi:hypothetical protein
VKPRFRVWAVLTLAGTTAVGFDLRFLVQGGLPRFSIGMIIAGATLVILGVVVRTVSALKDPEEVR